MLERAMEPDPVLLEEFTKLHPETAAEATAECLDRQEKASRGINPSGAVRSKATGRNDVVGMGMVLEVLSSDRPSADS